MRIACDNKTSHIASDTSLSMRGSEDAPGPVRRLIHVLLSNLLALSLSQRWFLGLINLSAVVILWVLSSFLVNSLVRDSTYRKPFFITYINTGCFCFYLIPYLHRRKLSPRQFYRELISAPYVLEEGYGSNTTVAQPSTETNLEIGVRETIRLSLQFVALWFTANYVMNSSLSYTSVASQTILLSTSSFFTLLIGYFYAIERVNRNKIIGLVLSFAGVVIVTDIDASSTNPKASPQWVVWGNALALLGAVIYGAYTTLLKKKITIHNSQLERNLDTHLFFAFVGIFCLLLLWPILLILHFTELEPFALPHTREVTAVVIFNAAITFVSDLCWCKAVLLTSPLTVTVGLSMTIPLAMVGDWLLTDLALNAWYLFGAVIVMVGFFIINRDEKRDSELDQGQ